MGDLIPISTFFVFFFFFCSLTISSNLLICFHPQHYMDFLYMDSNGTVPTSGHKVMPAGEWVALNASAGKIPSTDVFQQALEDHAFQTKESCTCLTGWTWTKEPTWSSQRYHWDAWNMVKSFSDEDDNVPWYFSDGSSPRVSASGKFYLDKDV